MKRLTRSQTFLLELTIDLLVFCVCASICLMLLAQANRLSMESGELGGAVTAAASAAEAFKASNGDMGNEILAYDARWSLTGGEPAYTLHIVPQQAGGRLREAQASVHRVSDGKLLYELVVTRFSGGVGA